MINNTLPSVIFGLLLTVGGCTLLWFHLRAWNRGPFPHITDEQERARHRLRFRRRLQIAVLLILLGIIIPVGDTWIGIVKSPVLLTVYVFSILMIALWLVLLAMFDWISSRPGIRAVRAELAGLERKRRELEEELARRRNPPDIQKSNGHH